MTDKFMAYIDQEGYLRYTQEEEETMREVKSHFTPQGYQQSEWVKNIINWLGEYKSNENI